jgi:UDPglucose 6-dehydrogenase
MNIAIAGAGFVGIVHAAAMASQENKVILFDINEKRVQDLNAFCRGEKEDLPIHEPGLPSLLKEAYKKGLLNFTTNKELAIKSSEVIFICVGTPSLEDGKANIKYIESVAHDIGKVIQQESSYKLVVNKSTVPVGTAKKVREIIKQYTSSEFDVASNPETLAEGRAVRDSTMPKRIIVGVESLRARKIFLEIYSPFFLPQQEKIYFMSPESAELTKYACNAYLGSQVVLTNIFANTASKVGANWRDMIPAILSDIRIGKFVHPGLGFGGSCFRKDLSQLIHTIQESGGNEIDKKVLNTILNQNNFQKLVFNRVLDEKLPNKQGLTLGIWGLSFKKETNDIRDAPSLEVIPLLLKQGVIIKAHDPQANQEFLKEMQRVGIDTTNISLFTDKYQAIEGVDALIILNDWKTYKQPDFNTLREKMKNKLIFDGKDLLNYTQVKKEKDFEYFGIGRSSIKAEQKIIHSQTIEDLSL